MSIFVQVLCPADRLMSDKAACGPGYVYSTVGGCSSDILRAYQPISGLVDRRRIILA